MKRIIGIVIVLTLVLSLVIALAAPVSAAGAMKYGWNLSGAVAPVPPYGSLDIPGSETASKLIVNQPNGAVVANMTGVMNGLASNTEYTVYLSNGYVKDTARWSLVGNWTLDFNFGSDYMHNMAVTLQQLNGSFGGNGYYIPDTSYTWTVTGTVTGNSVSFHILYTGTNSGYYVDAIGTIAANGTMSGTWSNSSQSGTWTTTAGNATKNMISSGWPGLFTSTIQPFTFTTDASGSGSWHVNMTAADFPSVGGTFTLSVWINGNGATILVSDNFQVSITPTLTFTSGLNSDGNALSGSLASGFTITTGGGTGMHVLTLASPVATPALTDGNYAFTLKAKKAQQTTLTSYFAAKAGWTNDMKTQIGKEISGAEPFFYLNATSGIYSLVDNFKLWLGYPPAGSPLTIDDNYPVGTYVYAGTITGTNGVTLPITVILVVTR